MKIKFEISTIFNVSAKKIYETWLSSKGHTEMTGGDAEITDKADTDFEAWDGYITGRNITLEPYKKIVQTWRTSEFSDDEEDSVIEIKLEEQKRGTTLTLIHTNLPPHGKQYKQGWIDNYFIPMKNYFESLK